MKPRADIIKKPNIRYNKFQLNFLIFFFKKFKFFNFYFLFFYDFIFFNCFFVKIQNLQINVLNLFDYDCFEDDLISLKRWNFFFFNDYNLHFLNLISEIDQNSEFLKITDDCIIESTFDETIDTFYENKNFYFDFFFKKTSFLKNFEDDDDTSDDEDYLSDDEELEVYNCKKFFKITKKKTIKYLKKFFFIKKITKTELFLFLKKMKRKSLYDLNFYFTYTLNSVFSFFFFFLNSFYIDFLISKGFFYLNFKKINLKKKLQINSCYFFSCIFFSEIINLFFHFKEKAEDYLFILEKQVNKQNLDENFELFYSKKDDALIKLNNLINSGAYLNSTYFEIDYLTLSFFFFKNNLVSLKNYTPFNIFLYKLLLFK